MVPKLPSRTPEEEERYFTHIFSDIQTALSNSK
jgi:hypothetical protein